MGEKSHYNYRVEPQDVDFTLRATIPSLGSAILNTAGIDAHGKGFGVDALNADNHSWVLSRMAVEFDCQPGGSIPTIRSPRGSTNTGGCSRRVISR